MGEKAKQIYEDMNVKEMDGNTNICDSTSMGTVSESEDSINSECLAEEAFSSTSNIINGPLYELSELMTHLPMKRGLSMFYKGKAQSFASLAKVQSIQDLPKIITPYRKKIKSCKSYARGFDSVNHENSYTPKAVISKKASRLGKRTRPSIAVQK